MTCEKGPPSLRSAVSKHASNDACRRVSARLPPDKEYADVVHDACLWFLLQREEWVVLWWFSELHYFKELPYKEVAEQLGCTVENARLRVHRALKRLGQQNGDLAPT